MAVIKENINTIVICLCEIIVGILLMINPIGFTSGIIIIHDTHEKEKVGICSAKCSFKHFAGSNHIYESF